MRRPWVLWLQDILPDAAATTGLVNERDHSSSACPLARASRVPVRDAHRDVSRTRSPRTSVSKGVAHERITRIYNPATVSFRQRPRAAREPPYRLLYTGNIGYSQGLVEVVRAFQRSDASGHVKLVVVGHGELAGAVRAAITGARRSSCSGTSSPERAGARSLPEHASGSSPSAQTSRSSTSPPSS